MLTPSAKKNAAKSPISVLRPMPSSSGIPRDAAARAGGGGSAPWGGVWAGRWGVPGVGGGGAGGRRPRGWGGAARGGGGGGGRRGGRREERGYRAPLRLCRNFTQGPGLLIDPLPAN